MTWTLLDHTGVSFADGGTGHAVTLPGGVGPAANNLDVICVNSDTTVSTPPGFALATSFVGNQGSYVFWRKAAGGEAAAVTITTAGNFNTSVLWSRWSGANTIDVAGNSHLDSSGNTATPAFTSSALAAAGELAIAFGAITDSVTALAAAPSWSAGYTPLDTATIGVGGSASAVTGYSAYNSNAGAAAESPNVSWTNSYRNRYMLFVSFTAAAGGTTFTKAVAGSLGSAGALTKQGGKGIVGQVTATGVAAKATARVLAGLMAGVGALAKSAWKTFSGTISPAGAVTTAQPTFTPALHLTAGDPVARWTAGPPGTAWTADEPTAKWAAGSPTT